VRDDSLPPSSVARGIEQPADDWGEVRIRIEEIRELERKIIERKQALLLASAAAPLEQAAEQLSFLLLQTGDKTLAISLSYVDEVVQMPALEPLENDVTAIAGLANYHGETIAVIDVAAIATGTPREIAPSLALVICSVGSRRIGLMVDDSIEVVTVPRGAVTVSDEVLHGALRTSGVLRLPQGSAHVVDALWITLGVELANLVGEDAATPDAGTAR
jgi:chemotaxis signal transduction protein